VSVHGTLSALWVKLGMLALNVVWVDAAARLAC
jgi:hypothetical protein